MKKYTTKIVAVLALLLSPIISFAQYQRGSFIFPSRGTFADVIFWVLDWINIAIQGIIALAVLAFLWGVFQSIRKADDETARANGRNFIIYGVIGLAIMLSFWGLVGFVQRTFGLDDAIPQFNRPIQDSTLPGANPNVDTFTGQAVT